MVDFETLWNNYPSSSKMKAKCRNEGPNDSRPFDNYCAIMLSEALNKSGVSTFRAKNADKCWSHSGKRHILRAEALADWLAGSNIAGIGKCEKGINPKTFSDDLEGRAGIIFFKDYWRRGNESFERRTGDHIDLWNGSHITSSYMVTREALEFFGSVSDLNNCKEIWFWEVE